MNYIKLELEKRNFIIHYAKSYINNHSARICTGIKRDIDFVIEKGIHIIHELDTMFWIDDDYIVDLLKYLSEGDKALMALCMEINDPFVNELTGTLYIQSKLFKKVIYTNSFSTSSENQKIPIPYFPLLTSSAGYPEFN